MPTIYNEKIASAYDRVCATLMIFVLLLITGCDIADITEPPTEEFVNLKITGTTFIEGDFTSLGGVTVKLYSIIPHESGWISVKDVVHLSTAISDVNGDYEINRRINRKSCWPSLKLEGELVLGDSVTYTSSKITNLGGGINVECSEKPQVIGVMLKKWGPYYYEKNYATIEYAGTGGQGNQDGDASLATFRTPLGLDVDAQDNLYVADSGNDRIRLIDSEQWVSTLAGSTKGYLDGPAGQALFSDPVDVILETDGSLLVADRGNFRIRRIGKDGMVTSVAGNGQQGFRDGDPSEAEFSNIKDLAAGKDGTIYLSDEHRIRVITSDNRVKTLAGDGVAGFQDGPGSQALFNEPVGIALNPDGSVLYVADQENRVIRSIDLMTGIVSTLAGVPEYNGYNFHDGTASNAKFDEPRDITVDDQGNLFVIDGGKIRKISINGWVSSVSNQGESSSFFEFRGIAIGKRGDLFISKEYSRILKYRFFDQQ